MFSFHCAVALETDSSLKRSQGASITCSFPVLDFELICAPADQELEFSFQDGFYSIHHHSLHLFETTLKKVSRLFTVGLHNLQVMP